MKSSSKKSKVKSVNLDMPTVGEEVSGGEEKDQGSEAYYKALEMIDSIKGDIQKLSEVNEELTTNLIPKMTMEEATTIAIKMNHAAMATMPKVKVLESPGVPDEKSVSAYNDMLSKIKITPPDNDSLPMGADTMKGSEKDSYFLVIAKKSGLKLGIRPLLMSLQDNGKNFLYMGFRLRCEVASPDGSILNAHESFGMKFRESKVDAAHLSIECGTKLVQIPCSATEAYKQWQDNFVTQSLVSQLLAHLEKHKATMTATADQITDYLNLLFDSKLPNLPTENPTEFPLIFGLGNPK